MKSLRRFFAVCLSFTLAAESCPATASSYSTARISGVTTCGSVWGAQAMMIPVSFFTRIGKRLPQSRSLAAAIAIRSIEDEHFTALRTLVYLTRMHEYRTRRWALPTATGILATLAFASGGLLWGVEGWSLSSTSLLRTSFIASAASSVSLAASLLMFHLNRGFVNPFRIKLGWKAEVEFWLHIVGAVTLSSYIVSPFSIMLQVSAGLLAAGSISNRIESIWLGVLDYIHLPFWKPGRFANLADLNIYHGYAGLFSVAFVWMMHAFAYGPRLLALMLSPYIFYMARRAIVVYILQILRHMDVPSSSDRPSQSELKTKVYSAEEDDQKIDYELEMRLHFKGLVQFRVPFTLMYPLARLFGVGPFRSQVLADRFATMDRTLMILTALVLPALGAPWQTVALITLLSAWPILQIGLAQREGIAESRYLLREAVTATVAMSALVAASFFADLPHLLRSLTVGPEFLFPAIVLCAAISFYVTLSEFSFVRRRLVASAEGLQDALRFLQQYSPGFENRYLEAASVFVRHCLNAYRDRPFSSEDQALLLGAVANPLLDTEARRVLAEAVATSLQQKPETLPDVVRFALAHPDDELWTIVFGTYNQYSGAVWDPDSVARIAGSQDLTKQQDFIDRVIDPLVFKFPEHRLTVLGHLSADAQKRSLVGLTSHPEIGPHYAMTETLRRTLASGEPEVLIVHNIWDGRGDELIRTIAPMESLLAYNPRLKITILTGRPLMYHHPRVTAYDIRSTPIDRTKAYALVIGHFEPTREFRPDAKEDLERYLRSEQFRGHDPFVALYRIAWENLYLGPSSERTQPRFLPRNWNVYATAYHLLAALGIPFTYGERSLEHSVLLNGAATQSYGDTLVKPHNLEGRPVLLFNGFGGSYKAKGYVYSPQLAYFVMNLIEAGYFVILMPNHQPWGSEERARAVINALPASAQANAWVPSLDPTDEEAYAQLVGYSDFVLTVEGGLVHLAYALGRPLGVLFVPESGDLLWWMPLATGAQQFAIRTDWGSPIVPYLPLVRATITQQQISDPVTYENIETPKQAGRLTLQKIRNMMIFNVIVLGGLFLSDIYSHITFVFVHAIFAVFKLMKRSERIYRRVRAAA